MLRSFLAPNASALTLDGTRSYVVGETRTVVIDPGSADPAHLDRLAEAAGAGAEAVVLTHEHPDHAGGAEELAGQLGCPVRSHRRRNLADGTRLRTDAGELVAVATPGHTTDHVCLHWPEQGAVFCGDLMMGGHDTALVAPPEGRLGPYLASLERIRRLEPRVIHPAHGEPFDNPQDALDRYVRHRELRQRQVLDGLRAGARDYDALVDRVYGGGLDPELRPAATAALKAYLEHLQALGRVRRVGRGWQAVD